MPTPPPARSPQTLSRLCALGAAAGVALDGTQVARLAAHLALITKWSRVYNLTAVRDPAAMQIQHLADCLAVAAALRRHAGDRPLRLLDVGSGAGFPGVVLAVCLPQVSVTCVETVGKKAAFLQQVAVELSLPNLQSRHARVETMGGDERFDLITARAFSSLASLVALSRPLIAPEGVWAAMKGQTPSAEIAALPPEVEVFHVEHLKVPELDAQRCLVWMRLPR